MEIVLTSGVLALSCLISGFIFALVFLPCIWLGLGRAPATVRLRTGLGMICLIPGVIATMDLIAGVVLAMYLLATIGVLLAWRHFCYERLALRFTLSGIFLMTFCLAVVLTIYLPQVEHLPGLGSIDWPEQVARFVVLTSLPAIYAWTSLSLKRRLWAVLPITLAVAVFFHGLNANQDSWLTAGGLWMFQLGFALSTIAFVRINLCNLLVIFPEGVRREPLPRHLPWSEPFPDMSSEEG